MRLKALIALFTGMFMASALAAQVAPVVPPPPAADPENILLLDLSTGGRVAIQLRPDVAPGHVERMKTLTRRGFYNGLTFHRVIEGFMAQGGDPKGDGTGGSDLPDLKAEFNGLPHVRGALAAARSEEPDSANSQFFLMLAPRLTLDGKYTVYGRVVSGMNFVDAITRGEPPVNPTRILQASIASDNRPVPVAAPAPVVGPVANPAGAATTPQ
jgi:peptidylprolyl isomerase